MPARPGFTLVELLVAMAIFAFGVMAVFGLFLAGVKARSEADALVRCTIATQSIVEDIRLDARAGAAPSAYLGDGFAHTATDRPGVLHAYGGMDGVRYVVESAEDAAQVGTAPPAIRLRLLVLHWPGLPEGTSLEDLLLRELRWRVPEARQADREAWFRDELVARGLAMRTSAMIVPRADWAAR